MDGEILVPAAGPAADDAAETDSIDTLTQPPATDQCRVGADP